MKLKFITAEEGDKNLKATIHTSGKLGFSDQAQKRFAFSLGKSVSFAINEDDPEDKAYYVIINEGEVPGAFKLNKAGAYYYLNTKQLFDKEGLDYVNKRIIFDIKPIQFDGNEVLKFIIREINKKQTKEETTI